MNDKRFEELSALMDGETSEMEVRRLLKLMDDDPELVATWDRMHRVRHSLVQDENMDLSLDISGRVMAAIEADEQVFEGGSSAYLGEESAIQSRGPQAAAEHSWYRKMVMPVTQTAVAASVAISVMFGWQSLQVAEQQQGHANSAQVAQAGSTLPTRTPVMVPNSGPQSGLAQVSLGTSSSKPVYSMMNTSKTEANQANAESYQLVRSGATVQLGAQPQMNQRQQQILDNYFMTHAGNAALNTSQGMMPFARVVTIKKVDGK